MRAIWFSMVVGPLLSVAGAAIAAPQCPTFYLDQTAPAGTSIVSGTTKELCFSHFAVLHSGETRTPLWSAQHLTDAEANGGDHIDRVDKFHAEKALTKSDRAELADYKGFKDIWDRGHLTPADDAPDYPSQAETFTLANMVPQASMLNRYTWQYLEASLHVLAEQQGELYLVTGPIFLGSPQRLRNRVAIPAYTFKAVYDPKAQQAIAYVATNVNEPVCWVISVAQLIQMSGLDPFPSLPTNVKSAAQPWVLPPGTGGRPVPDCGSVPPVS